MPEGENEEVRDGDDDPRICQWVSQTEALRQFAEFAGRTQSARQIKPLHWYVACRLVIEGGFHPDDIVPRPPFEVVKRRGKMVLSHLPERGSKGERTILGGLKTKNVDVVVTKEGLGPVLAVSCKGVTGAFRNLTNRMEETIGECTNLHITYPAMVLGYVVLLRANRATEEAVAGVPAEGAPPARQLAANDIAIQRGGEPVESIIRFHSALRELAGRRGIRDDLTRYEAMAMALVDTEQGTAGRVDANFPPQDSALRLEQFFKTMYLRYDERYVYSAPNLKNVTRRLEWAEDSPAFAGDGARLLADYDARIDHGAEGE